MRLFLFACLWVFCNGLSAQPEYHLLFQARSAYCKGDTAATIRLLETQLLRYPDSTNREMVFFALGRIHAQQGDSLKAQRAYEKVLSPIVFKPGKPVPDDTCNLFFHNAYNPYLLRAEACVALAHILARNQAYTKALDLLHRAEGEFQPYRTCGNGINMYRSSLSLDYATIYLAQGKTQAAQQRLLKYFDCPDGPSMKVANALKNLLLQRYSRVEIAGIFRKAIDNIHLDANGNTVCEIKGAGMTRRNTYSSLTPDALKVQLLKNPAWKLMMDL